MQSIRNPSRPPKKETHMTFTKDNSEQAREANAKGRLRMKEIADEMRNDVTVVASAMLRGLGRPWNEFEELEAQAIASLHLKAARMRALGRNDIELLREAAVLKQSSVFASRHPVAMRLPATEPSA
jgi:hypothetical protein